MIILILYHLDIKELERVLKEETKVTNKYILIYLYKLIILIEINIYRCEINIFCVKNLFYIFRFWKTKNMVLLYFLYSNILLNMKNKETEKIPSNIEAEQIIIASLIANNENYSQFDEVLHEDFFYDLTNSIIYKEIKRLLEKGFAVTLTTIAEVLKNNLEAESAIGKKDVKEYLVDIFERSEPVHGLKTYANIVYNSYLRRKLISLGKDIISSSSGSSDIVDSPMNEIEKIEQELFNLTTLDNYSSTYSDFSSTLKKSLKHIDDSRKLGKDISGIPSGLIDLDKLLGGFNNSDLLIIAARPSMGKTSLAACMALNCAKYMLEVARKDKEEKGSVAFFSLEMSAEQLATRALAVESGINSSKLRIGNVSSEDFVKISATSNEIENYPIFIDDTPAISISTLRTRARRLKRLHNLKILFIDYLQLLKGTTNRDGNRVQEIGEISQGLKAIAKELNIPVIALSQLSRAVETREDKRPQLSDLRESGNIEQDADVVMFIYRDEYYHARKKPMDENDEKYLTWQEQLSRIKNMAEVIIAKQRNGPIGNVKLRFNGDTTKFENFISEQYIPKQSTASNY